MRLRKYFSVSTLSYQWSTEDLCPWVQVQGTCDLHFLKITSTLGNTFSSQHSRFVLDVHDQKQGIKTRDLGRKISEILLGQFVELSENYQKLLLKYWIFPKSSFQKYQKCSNFRNFGLILLVDELVPTLWALIKCTKVNLNLRILSRVILSTDNDNAITRQRNNDDGDRRTSRIKKILFLDLGDHEMWIFVLISGS